MSGTPHSPVIIDSNLDQRAVDMYLEACTIGQTTRNDLIQLLSNPDMNNIIVGTCVRVLLELQDFSEDYMIAKVLGTQLGDAYSGFSQNANQATTIHLRLQLPSRLNGGNGNLYQLNSISNSPITRHEVEVWMSLTAADGGRPEAQSLISAGGRLRSVVPARHRRGGGGGGAAVVIPPPSSNTSNNNANTNALAAPTDLRRAPTNAAPQQPSQQPSVPPSSARLNATHVGGTAAAGAASVLAPTATKRRLGDEKSPSGNGRSAARAEMASEAINIGPRELVYQMMLKEKSSDSTLFKKTLQDMRTSELRTLERDVGEYLDRVREAISNNQQRCVVCMDRVPTVIIMPCRHRVLCRWCTLMVEACPMCRGVATELFEPIEQ